MLFYMTVHNLNKMSFSDGCGPILAGRPGSKGPRQHAAAMMRARMLSVDSTAVSTLTTWHPSCTEASLLYSKEPWYLHVAQTVESSEASSRQSLPPLRENPPECTNGRSASMMQAHGSRARRGGSSGTSPIVILMIQQQNGQLL